MRPVEDREKISAGLKRAYQEGRRPLFRSEETKRKVSQTLKAKGIKPPTCHIGHIAWNKGLKGVHLSPETEFRGGDNKGSANVNWKGGPPKCIDCGKELTDYHRGRCINCYHKYNCGPNHYKWNGGPKTELERIRTSAEYKAWRLAIYKRDLFTCQMPSCGYKGKYIEAHHIKKVENYPELIFEINNGITLCRDCHNAIRKREEMFEKLFQEIIDVQITAQLP